VIMQETVTSAAIVTGQGLYVVGLCTAPACQLSLTRVWSASAGIQVVVFFPTRD
jgi:hypothetical protein